MNRIALAIGVFIIGMFVYNKIATNINDNNIAVYPSISELEQPSEENLRVYDNDSDFPLDEIIFSDHDAFTLLKNSYKDIDFYGDFEPGNLELYDYFKLNFWRLINNEVPFIRKTTGEKIYLKEFNELYSDSTHKFNPDNYLYHFFDMNEDGNPELFIKDYLSNTFIFDYNSDSDEFTLIHELCPSYYQLNGSNKIRWEGAGGSRNFRVFYKYNELNEEEYSVYFFSAPNYNEILGESESVYMAGLPHYTNRCEKIIIPDNIKKQAYFTKSHGIYYFRITEEQYVDLTSDYYKATRLAKERLENITYTYNELFAK